MLLLTSISGQCFDQMWVMFWDVRFSIACARGWNSNLRAGENAGRKMQRELHVGIVAPALWS
jgi:hypothetical protein